MKIELDHCDPRNNKESQVEFKKNEKALIEVISSLCLSGIYPVVGDFIRVEIEDGFSQFWGITNRTLSKDEIMFVVEYEM